MAKRELVGTCICPECGKSGAEVKTQKNGLLYRFCPDCNAQYFPRTGEMSARLAAQCGIVPAEEIPVTVTAAPKPEAEALKPEAQAPKPKPKSSSLGDALALLGGGGS